MKTYLLVHGAFNTGELWDKEKKLLEENKSRVFCPTLKTSNNSTLTEDIEQVCNLIEDEDLFNIILVGFSYSGFVVTGVVDRLFQRISHLVYIDTAICKSNKALVDYIDLKKFGLKEEKPFTEKLKFDEKKIRQIPKTYIFCTKSEFKEMTEKSYNYVIDHAKEEDWTYYTIESDHKCMVSKPEELFVILKNINV